ncbi:MAG: hypothetical protein C0410_06280 [Anaerolinea sp.]|nr:hypothetical protein [Anaerolinea sp.]
MKKQKMILWALTLVTVIALAACAAQPTAQPEVQATATPAITATTAATDAAGVESTATAAPTATTEPTATLEPTATANVEPTATSEFVATPTALTAYVGGKVTLSLAKNTNCRTGPDTVYPSVASIPAGQQVNAVGKLDNNLSYLYIENPSLPGSYCWVFSEGAALQGNRADLVVVEPLPTPTQKSEMGFSLTYSGIQECVGGDYAFNLVVANTDKMVWKSIKIYIVDANTQKSATYSSDHFEGWTDCHVDWYQNDLTKGEHAFISPYNPGHFDYRPYGGTFFVRVKVCSEDGLTGTCLNKEIKVQP